MESKWKKKKKNRKTDNANYVSKIGHAKLIWKYDKSDMTIARVKGNDTTGTTRTSVLETWKTNGSHKTAAQTMSSFTWQKTEFNSSPIRTRREFLRMNLQSWTVSRTYTYLSASRWYVSHTLVIELWNPSSALCSTLLLLLGRTITYRQSLFLDHHLHMIYRIPVIKSPYDLRQLILDSY